MLRLGFILLLICLFASSPSAVGAGVQSPLLAEVAATPSSARSPALRTTPTPMPIFAPFPTRTPTPTSSPTASPTQIPTPTATGTPVPLAEPTPPEDAAEPEPPRVVTLDLVPSAERF